MKIAVVGILEGPNDTVLIGLKKESGGDLAGEWEIPGGLIKEGEKPQDALVREIMEEANLTIKVNKYIDLFEEPGVKVMWFLCEVVSGVLQPGSDLVDVRFVARTRAESLCGAKAVARWPQKVKELLNSPDKIEN